jgi:hypothetical protein
MLYVRRQHGKVGADPQILTVDRVLILGIREYDLAISLETEVDGNVSVQGLSGNSIDLAIGKPTFGQSLVFRIADFDAGGNGDRLFDRCAADDADDDGMTEANLDFLRTDFDLGNFRIMKLDFQLHSRLRRDVYGATE